MGSFKLYGTSGFRDSEHQLVIRFPAKYSKDSVQGQNFGSSVSKVYWENRALVTEVFVTNTGVEFWYLKCKMSQQNLWSQTPDSKRTSDGIKFKILTTIGL